MNAEIFEPYRLQLIEVSFASVVHFKNMRFYFHDICIAFLVYSLCYRFCVTQRLKLPCFFKLSAPSLSPQLYDTFSKFTPALYAPIYFALFFSVFVLATIFSLARLLCTHIAAILFTVPN